MPLKLHVVKGKDPGQVIVIADESAMVIGRKNADLCLDDQMLSRQHVRVELRQGKASIHDLGSSNGTFLNGDRIEEGQLFDGDKIKIGSHILHVEMSDGAAGASGSADAAQGGIGAVLAARPIRKRELVFCGRCYRSVPREEARDVPGAVLCPDCAEGAAFDPGMIEGFKLAGKVADGRLGPLFKARHLALHKYVMLRIVRSDCAVEEQALRRFIRQAKIGGRLHHPNIIAMFDAAQSRGHYYITLEYVDGETLEERIARTGKVDAAEVARIGAAIADALQYAWDSQQIVHRNVKPASIFLGKTGQVKLGDFGLAKSLDPSETVSEATASGEPWGTLHYMPPEQLEDSRSVDARADVYALGATLYHAVTGSRPFEGPSVVDTIERIRAGAIEPADKLVGRHCPRALAACLARAMDREPGRRFASAADLRAALQAL